MKKAARLDIPALAELYLRFVPVIDEASRKRVRGLTMAEVRQIRGRVLDDVCDRAAGFSSARQLEKWIGRRASRHAGFKILGTVLQKTIRARDRDLSARFEGGMPSRPPCELEAWRFARKAKKRIDKRRETPAPPLGRIAGFLAGVAVVIVVLAVVVAANTNSAHQNAHATFELLGEQGRPAQLLPLREGQSLETEPGRGAVALFVGGRIGLAPETKLRLATIRDETLEVELERGSLAGQLDDEKPGRDLEIRSGRITVRASAAKVAVKRFKDEVEVRIARRSAEVLHDGVSVGVFRAPQILRLGQTGRLAFIAAGDESFNEVDALLQKSSKKAPVP